MKRILTAALALVLAFGLLSTTVLAADGPKSGICNIEIKDTNYTFSVPEGTEKILDNGKTVYLGAEYFMLTSSSAGSGYKLVLTQSSEGIPTVDNIVYINQSEDTTSVSFKIYPSKLSADGTYYVYISSSTGTGRTLVATFSYYQEYKLGDADNNGTVDSLDAVQILKAIVGNAALDETQKLAADADGNGTVDSLDAVAILKYIVGNGTLGKAS